MAGFFKNLFATTIAPASSPLYFKDAEAAFEFACEHLQCELVPQAVLPALVMDAVKLGAQTPVVVAKDGTQTLALSVCSKDFGFLVLSSTASANGPRLKPGDLVAWQAGKTIERESADLTKDPRSKWVGLVLAKLKPEYASGRGWAIEMPFRPQ